MNKIIFISAYLSFYVETRMLFLAEAIAIGLTNRSDLLQLGVEQDWGYQDQADRQVHHIKKTLFSRF